MLDISNLHLAYGKVPVLHDISLEIAEHEVVTLIGPNGAGKTSLMMALSGINPTIGGSFSVDGVDLTGKPPHGISRFGVAQVAQRSHLFPDMSVHENLLLGTYRHENGMDHSDMIDRIHTYFPILRKRASQKAGSLSGGEQKMLAFGRALISRPKLLLLDEPSSGLSPRMVDELADVVRALRQDRSLTTLIVEQNAVMALGIADRGYLLESGRITVSGSTEELGNSDEVRVAYLGM